MGVAFFDFDKTLIDANSARLWLRHEWRAGRVDVWSATRAVGFLLQYRLGKVGLEASIRSAIASLRGQSEAVLRERVASFYSRDVRHRYRPAALDAVRTHREAGDALVLLTSASVYLAEVVQAELGFDAILCNRFEVDADGNFTGEPVEPVCYGEGKRSLAQAWLEGSPHGWEDAAFYTDSMADVSVLDRVARPIVVNPDPRLFRRARNQGWPIVDWD